MSKLERYKPVVAKEVLLLLAGGLWFCVGCMLLCFAGSWLSAAENINRSVFAGIGVVLAVFVHHFGFQKIADKNLARLLPLEEKMCVFSFMPWKSYLIILIMMAMGATLRHSAIPKHYLAILYTGIGLALILSSMRYMRAFLKEIQ